MIVLRLTHPADMDTLSRLQARVDHAVQNRRVIIVDSSVEVYTDEKDLIRIAPNDICSCDKEERVSCCGGPEDCYHRVMR